MNLNENKNAIIIVMGFIIISITLAALLTFFNPYGKNIAVNEEDIRLYMKLNDFTLPGIDGKNYSLSDYKGQFVILDLMATWCEPCKRVYAVFRDMIPNSPDVAFLSVSIDPETDTVDVLQTYAKEQNMTWPLLIDVQYELLNETKTEFIPHIMILKVLTSPDAEGKIGYVYYSMIGPPEYQQFTKTLDKVIEKYG